MTKEERKEIIRERILRHTSVSYNDNVIDELSDKNLRVAFYTCVAAPAPDQISSFELQKQMVKRRIERQPNWTLVSIYIDEGRSGNRKELSRMIEDCKAGRIDLIITKSASRIARNAVDFISVVNTLKSLEPPVGIWCESENIYTLNFDCDLALEVLSDFAEEESRIKALHGGGGHRWQIQKTRLWTENKRYVTDIRV